MSHPRSMRKIVILLVFCVSFILSGIGFAQTFPTIVTTGVNPDGSLYEETQYILKRQPMWFHTTTHEVYGMNTLSGVIQDGRAYMPYQGFLENYGAEAGKYGTIFQLPVPELLNGDDSELYVKLKNPYDEGGISARDVHLVIFGTEGKAEVNFVDNPAYEGYSFFGAGGNLWYYSRGALVKAFNNYKGVALIVKDQKVTVWMEGHNPYLIRRSFGGSIGTIKAIAIDFKGSASIDAVGLSTDGIGRFREEFDQDGQTSATLIFRDGYIQTGINTTVTTGEVSYPAIDFSVYPEPVVKRLTSHYENQAAIAMEKALEEQQQALNDAINEYLAGVNSTDQTDPINISNGSFVASQTVISLPNRGKDLNFVLNYDSSLEYEGPVGKNRDHNHNILAGVDPETQNLMIEYGNGLVHAFVPVASGVWHHSVLNADANINVAGNLEITYSDGSRQIFAQQGGDGPYKIWAQQDTYGNTISYGYDSQGRLFMISDDDGYIGILYNEDSLISHLVDSEGREVLLDYENTGEENYLKQIELKYNGATRVISYEYDSGNGDSRLNGNITKMIDAENNLYVENEYNTDDFVISQDYGGDVTDYEYTTDADGIVRTVEVDARNGSHTTYQFDQYGQATERKTITSDGDNNSEYFYDDYEKLVKEVLPDGQTVLYSYDENNNLDKVTVQPRFGSDAPRVWNYDFDTETKNLLKETTPAGLETRYIRNDKGDPLEIIEKDLNSGETRVWKMEYDRYGQVVKITDPEGHNKILNYTEQGQLKSSEISALGMTEYRNYDGQGQLVSYQNGEGNRRKYEYTAWGQVQKITSPLGISQAFKYDDTNNLLSSLLVETDGQQIKNNFNYNELDLVTSYQTPGSDENSTRNWSLERTPHHLLASQTSPLGQIVENEYDELDRLISQRVGDDYESVEKTRTYDNAGRVIGVVNELGDETKYSYDQRGNLAIVEDSEGGKWLMEYDINNNLKKISFVNANGQKLSEEVLVNSVWGEVLTKTTLVNPNQASSEDIMVKYQYNKLGQVVKMTDPRGASVSMAYDAGNRLQVQTDRLGNKTRYTYNKNSQVVQKTLVDTAGKSFVTKYNYDADGRLISVTDNLGQTSRYQYNNSGQIVKFTDAKGYATVYKYNPAGELISTHKHDGEQRVNTFYKYDAHGNLLELTDANGNVSMREYDIWDRPVQLSYPDGKTVTYQRDTVGNLVSWTDPNGTTVENDYDSLGRLLERNIYAGFDVLGVENENYQYDGLGRLISASDDQGNDLAFVYDGASRLIAEHNNENNLAYKYDPNGNQTEIVYPSGRKVWKDYDAGDRLTEINQQINVISEPSNVRTVQTSRYDSLRLLQDLSANSTTSSYAYDDLLRIASINHTTTNPAPYDSISYQYSYDAVNNIVSDGWDSFVYDHISQIKGTSYNVGNLVIGTNGELNTTDNNLWMDESDYDAMGNRQSIHTTVPMDDWFDSYDPNAGGFKKEPVSLDLDLEDELRVAEPELLALDEELLLAKNDTAVLNSSKNDDKTNNGNNEKTSSDPEEGTMERCQWKAEQGVENSGDGWLKKCAELMYGTGSDENDDGNNENEEGNNSNNTGSDATPPSDNGNGEGSSIGGRSWDDEVFSYEENNLNQYTSVSDLSGNTVEFRYDDNGNLIENDEFYFFYDYKNRLVRAEWKTPGEYMVVTMEYDVLDRRVEKNIDRKSNEGELVRYTYAGADAVQEDWSYNIGEGRNLKKEYIYGQGIDDIVSMILTRDDDYRQFRFHKNHQGSVIAVSDSEGKVVESYRYDTFGNIILGFQRNSGKQSTLNGAKNEQRDTAESKMWLKNDRLYTSREYDEELGMYYYRGRHYDPRIGRFIQRDPIGYADDVNLYRYVGNSWMNAVDPWGLSAKECIEHDATDKFINLLSDSIKTYESKGVFIDDMYNNTKDGGIWDVKRRDERINISFEKDGENKVCIGGEEAILSDIGGVIYGFNSNQAITPGMTEEKIIAWGGEFISRIGDNGIRGAFILANQDEAEDIFGYEIGDEIYDNWDNYENHIDNEEFKEFLGEEFGKINDNK